MIRNSARPLQARPLPGRPLPGRPLRDRAPARTLVRVMSLAAVASTIVVATLALPNNPASAAVGDVTTIVGSLGGPNPATTALDPIRISVQGTSAYISDDGARVVRRLATTTNVLAVAAGNGGITSGSDGVAATTSELYRPMGTAVGPDGDLYIADAIASKVRRVDAGTGIISTFAGTGSFGSTGDGGPAVAAKLHGPSGVAVAADGRVYIADTTNHRIRYVDTTGDIHTIAGTGIAGNNGDAGSATSATLNGPTDVVLNASNEVVILDAGNHRVRKINGANQMAAVAGTGTKGFVGDGAAATAAQLDTPGDIAFDANELLIADTGNRRIRKVTAGGTISTIAGSGASASAGDGGPPTMAGLPRPSAVDRESGVLYIGDTVTHTIRKVSGGVIDTIAGNGYEQFSGDGGQATAAQTEGVSGLVYAPNGDLYFADTWNGRVRRRATTGLVTTVVGGGLQIEGAVPALDAFLGFPNDLAMDRAGNIFIAEHGSHRIRRWNATTGLVTVVAGTGEYGFSGDGGPATSAKLSGPRGIEVDTDGTLYIADSANNRIRRVTPGGTISTVAGNGTEAFGGDGGSAVAASFDHPADMLVDGRGGLIVADTQNNRVRRILPDGVVVTIAGIGTTSNSGDGGFATDAGLDSPRGLALDAVGNLFVGAYSKVRMINPFGLISLKAGTGATGFSGDGGLAVNAKFTTIWSVALSPAGDLAVADYNAARIRRINGLGTTGATYHALTPSRILDSRDGTGGYATPWNAGTTRHVTVAGVGGVPATSVTSVVLNITVAGGTAGSHLTVWPKGAPQPLASNLNWPAGDTRPNLVTVKLGDAGKVSVFNNSGNVHVIADVVGWFDNAYSAQGDSFTALTPARVLDSRDGTGSYSTPWGPAATRSVTIKGEGGVPEAATAVVMNVTVTNTTAASHLTVWPAGTTKPVASNLNWPSGATRPNLVTVKIGSNGKVAMFNNAGTAHVIADVVGYYSTAGDQFFTMTPYRTLDTRDGTGGVSGVVGPGVTKSVKVTGRAGVSFLATAVVLNVTVTSATAGSHLTVWPGGAAKPTASNLNWETGQTVPNLVVVKVGSGGTINVFNNSGNVHVIADVVGWYQ